MIKDNSPTFDSAALQRSFFRLSYIHLLIPFIHAFIHLRFGNYADQFMGDIFLMILLSVIISFKWNRFVPFRYAQPTILLLVCIFFCFETSNHLTWIKGEYYNDISRVFWIGLVYSVYPTALNSPAGKACVISAAGFIFFIHCLAYWCDTTTSDFCHYSSDYDNEIYARSLSMKERTVTQFADSVPQFISASLCIFTLLINMQRYHQFAVQTHSKTKRSVHAKNIALFNTSHEIIAPLHAIVGNTDLLLFEKDTLSSSDIESLTSVLAISRQISFLADTLTEYTRFESKGSFQAMLPYSFTLSSLISTASESLYPIEHKCKIRIDATLESLEIYDDIYFLHRMFTLVCSNAIKFGRGEIEIDAWSLSPQEIGISSPTEDYLRPKLLRGHHSRANGIKIKTSLQHIIQRKEAREAVDEAHEIIEMKWIRFRITDNGFGIEDKEVYSIFTPFYRIKQQEHATRQFDFGGIGIGLHLFKSMIQHLGGRIIIETKVDIGTSICFDLPIQIIRPPSHIDSIQRPRMSSEGEIVESAIRRSSLHYRLGFARMKQTTITSSRLVGEAKRKEQEEKELIQDQKSSLHRFLETTGLGRALELSEHYWSYDISVFVLVAIVVCFIMFADSNVYRSNLYRAAVPIISYAILAKGFGAKSSFLYVLCIVGTHNTYTLAPAFIGKTPGSFLLKLPRSPIHAALLFYAAITFDPAAEHLPLLTKFMVGGLTCINVSMACILFYYDMGWAQPPEWLLNYDTMEGDNFRDLKRLFFVLVFQVAFFFYAIHRRDVSVRKLKVSIDSMNAANRNKRMFLHSLSRELGTALHGISGHVEELSSSKYLSSFGAQSVNLLHTCVQTLSYLTQDLNSLTNIEDGVLRIRKSTVNVDKLCRECLDIMRLRVEHEGNRVSLTNSAPEQSRGVYTDAYRVQQVVINLLNNANKFTEEGEIRLKISARKTSSSTQDLVISIRDDGIGIPRNQQAKIFSAFERVEGADHQKLQTSKGGLGLGLFICSKIAGLLQGRIELQSEPGLGSLFSLVIPCESDDSPQNVNETAIGSTSKEVPSRAITKEEAITKETKTGVKVNMQTKPKTNPNYQKSKANSARINKLPNSTKLTDDNSVSTPQSSPSPPLIAVKTLKDKSAGTSTLKSSDQRQTGDLTQHTMLLFHDDPIYSIRDISPEEVEDLGLRQAARRFREPVGEERKLVLVVDDNRTNRLIGLRQLTVLGYKAHAVESGEKALELYEDYLKSGSSSTHLLASCSTVLMDVHMPGLNGYETSLKIRELERQYSVNGSLGLYIIITTGYEPAMSLVYDDFLVRPVQRENLGKKLEEVM